MVRLSLPENPEIPEIGETRPRNSPRPLYRGRGTAGKNGGMDRQHPRHPSQGAEGDAADTLRLALAWFAAADAGAPLPAEVQAWHRHALAAVLAGEADSLDVALGLVQAGQERLSTRYRRLCRDAHLRAAWELLDEPAARRRSNALADAVADFRIKWLRARGQMEPARLSAVEAELFHAFTVCGDPGVPTSVKHLDRIVRAAMDTNPPGFRVHHFSGQSFSPVHPEDPEEHA